MAQKRGVTSTRSSSKSNGPINSITDFARRLDLSAWTVSRAINGHPEVNEKTRQRILRAMDELGFRPNPLAAGLGGRRTNLVGVCFIGLGNPVIDQKLFYLQEFLRERHLRSLLEVRPRNPALETRAIEDFQRIRVDGIVLLHSDLDAASSSRIVRDGACVHVDPHARQKAPCVSVDRYKAMRLLIDHLRAFGHRTFGMIGVSPADGWRWPALMDIARIYDFDPKTSYLLAPDDPTLDSQIAKGQFMAEALLKLPQRPTALITENDQFAIGAIQALREHGLEVPRDMSVTGFDNLDIGRRLHPTLTTIDQNSKRLMERAVDTLVREIALPRPQRGKASLETVEPALIIGESTGPAPKLSA